MDRGCIRIGPVSGSGNHWCTSNWDGIHNLILTVLYYPLNVQRGRKYSWYPYFWWATPAPTHPHSHNSQHARSKLIGQQPSILSRVSAHVLLGSSQPSFIVTSSRFLASITYQTASSDSSSSLRLY